MLYVIRRHLGFSREEWERLPWHDQLMYLEGLQEEFYDSEAGDFEDISEDWSAIESLGAQTRRIEVSG